jgi:O-antigen ligase
MIKLERLLNLEQSLSLDRTKVAGLLLLAARISFAAAIVLAPFRYRWVLASRPSPPIYKDFTDFLLFASDPLVISTVLFWLAGLAVQPYPVKLGPLFLFLPICAITFFSLLSVVASVDPLLSLYHAVRLLILAGLYLYIVNEMTSLGVLFLASGLQLFIQAGVSIAQVFSQGSVGLQKLGELPLNPAWSGVSIVSAGTSRYLRAYGLSDHPNILGGCLVFSLVLMIGWYLTARIGKTALAALILLGLLSLLFTFSRSAWLAFICASIWILYLLYKTGQKSTAASLLGLSAAGLIFMLPFIWQAAPLLGIRLDFNRSFASVPQENQSIGERRLLIDAADKIFAAHALTGVGLGAFPQALRQAQPDLPVDYQPVHFVLLDVAAEIGIFGALFYLVILFAPWISMWLYRERLEFSLPLLAASALLMSITIIGFFDYYPWLLAPGRLWGWTAWGVWGTVYQSSFHEVQDA